MKNQKNRCPGCSRHCPMDAPRCKYGCKYFGKQKADSVETEAPVRKWERNLQRGGLIWRLRFVGRSAGKALRDERVTEEELLSTLSGAQQAQLADALSALEKYLSGCKKAKK